MLAVTLCNGEEDVLGHAAFFDYPNLPGVDPADWEAWLNQTYSCNKCTAINTLFLHYFVAKPEYSHGCAAEIIRTVYNAIPELHYCYLVVPTGVYPGTRSIMYILDRRIFYIQWITFTSDRVFNMKVNFSHALTGLGQAIITLDLTHILI